MVTLSRLIIFLFVLSLIACEKNNENSAPSNDQLIGSWHNPQHNDSIVTYERSKGLIDNEYGFSFNEDNTFKVIIEFTLSLINYFSKVFRRVCA